VSDDLMPQSVLMCLLRDVASLSPTGPRGMPDQPTTHDQRN
jgi:hypothetical protein